MPSLDRLLQNNQAWAKQCVRDNPRYFQNLVNLQNPQYLWIGCSDARVPANTIVGLNPGEVFVHRNVANQIQNNDLNCQSVLQFAVEFLQVQDILVCGHYGCGGVACALDDKKLGLIDTWLKPLKILAKKHESELKTLSAAARHKRLCEINIKEQVQNVCATPSVQNAWKAGRTLSVHGIIYDLADGLLKTLDLCVNSNDDLQKLKP